jgi:putative membrane protein
VTDAIAATGLGQTNVYARCRMLANANPHYPTDHALFGGGKNQGEIVIMWPHGPWEWFPMWIIPLIFLVAVLLIILRGGSWRICGGQGMQTRDRQESAKEILDRRYASGEINREEYLQMKKDLE